MFSRRKAADDEEGDEGRQEQVSAVAGDDGSDG